MTESIQSFDSALDTTCKEAAMCLTLDLPTTTDPTVDDASMIEARQAAFAHVGEVFGLPLTHAQLAEIPGHTDLEVVRTLFPHLLDVEQAEVLWAVGESSRRLTPVR
jgi:hypothetical protein